LIESAKEHRAAMTDPEKGRPLYMVRDGCAVEPSANSEKRPAG
jgi:hypothetical protein